MRDPSPQDYGLPSSPACRCGGQMHLKEIDTEPDWPMVFYEHPACGRSFGVQVDEEGNVKQTDWV